MSNWRGVDILAWTGVMVVVAIAAMVIFLLGIGAYEIVSGLYG